MLKHLIRPLRAASLVPDVVRKWVRDREILMARRRVLEITQDVLSHIDLPAEPMGIVAFIGCGFDRDDAISALLMRRVAETGWLPVLLTNYLRLPSHPDSELAALNGLLVRRSSMVYHLNDEHTLSPLGCRWEIDMDAQICRADGIDLFSVINGKLQRALRAYTFDYSHPTITQMLKEVVASADACLRACYRVHEAAAKRGIPVRFTGAEHVYVPTGVPVLYCDQRGRGAGIEFVDFGDAYAHYFSAGEYLSENFFAVQNLTQTKNTSRHVIQPKDFHRWRTTQKSDGLEELEVAKKVLTQSWTGLKAIEPESQAILQRIADHRAAGKPVACIFGHVTFDLGTINDNGFVHSDMAHWLNDTIEQLNGTDTLVLIKPHPTEKRHKPSRKPSQLLVDLIQVPMRDNIFLLDPLALNAGDILEQIDVGLVWRSSVAYELSLLDKPVVVCGAAAAYVRVLELHYPDSFASYYGMLSRLSELTSFPGAAQRVALIYRYMKERQFVSLPYMAKGQLKNYGGFRYRSGAPYWKENELQKFLTDGDPSVDRVVQVLVG